MERAFHKGNSMCEEEESSTQKLRVQPRAGQSVMQCVGQVIFIVRILKGSGCSSVESTCQYVRGLDLIPAVLQKR